MYILMSIVAKTAHQGNPTLQYVANIEEAQVSITTDITGQGHV